MYTLGINAALGDPSACLVKNGRIIAAAEEERFTGTRTAGKRIPFAPCELPFLSIDYCLAEEKIVLSDVDHVAYSFNPFLLLQEKTKAGTVRVQVTEESSAVTWPKDSEWEPLFLSAIARSPRQLSCSAPGSQAQRLGDITPDGPFVWHFVDHQLAHAAGAFLASPFSSAAVMTIDAGGEKAATSYSLGSGNTLTGLGEVGLPNSLGKLASRVTEFLGFRGSVDECKLAELSSLGKPVYAGEFRRLIQVTGNGHYITHKIPLEELFGPPRGQNDPIEKKYLDIASSLQMVLQETILQLAGWLKEETREKRLCVAGTITLNHALNTFLSRNGPFTDIWIHPAAGDAGSAIGAALWIDSLERKNLHGPKEWVMEHADLGPSYSDLVIEELLIESRVFYRKMADTAEETADLLAAGKFVGWFQGRMELGPRPLGYRSILASPLRTGLRKELNALKGRESFRPLAAAIAAEDCREWFENPQNSPFMLFSCQLKPEKLRALPEWGHPDGLTHMQTVEPNINPLFHALLKAFKKRTGIPILASTSLNSAGNPAACSPRDALEYFWTSGLDALAIGPFLVLKPGMADRAVEQESARQ